MRRCKIGGLRLELRSYGDSAPNFNRNAICRQRLRRRHSKLINLVPGRSRQVAPLEKVFWLIHPRVGSTPPIRLSPIETFMGDHE